jgi:membrane-bound serine protease (ClpP class)
MHAIAEFSGPAPVLRRIRPALAALLLSVCVVCLMRPAAWGAEPAQPLRPGYGAVDIVEVGGTIDGVVTRFLAGAIVSANRRGVEVLVVRLDSPAGIGGDLAALLRDVRASQVPVTVWVGPPGARATGAGFWIAEHAHVLALSPASALGMALPVEFGRWDPPGVTARDGRSAEFVRQASSGGLVVAVPDGETGVPVPPDAVPPGADRAKVRTLDEAALAQAGIADFVASSLPQVLARLDGLTVTVAGPGGGPVARTLHIDPQAASVRFVNMGPLARVLHAVASPTLAYLLVIAGALALAFEIFQPGFGVAGVSGIALLALGGYGLWALPTRWGGVALIVLGLGLLAADLALARLGWLTAGGAVALAAGSWLAFPGPGASGAAVLRPPAWLLGSVIAFCVVFFAVIMTVVLRAQGNQALASAQTVVGSVGVVRSVLNPEGHVFVRGGLWRARAPEASGLVRTGTKVRVLGMNEQLTLDVEVVEGEAAPAPETAGSGA